MRLTLGQCIFLNALKQEIEKETIMSKKVKISSKALNELISKMSKHENAFGKLNAGEKREQAKSVLLSLLDCSAPTQAEIASAMIKSV